jgi:hypothetical protein
LSFNPHRGLVIFSWVASSICPTGNIRLIQTIYKNAILIFNRFIWTEVLISPQIKSTNVREHQTQKT